MGLPTSYGEPVDSEQHLAVCFTLFHMLVSVLYDLDIYKFSLPSQGKVSVYCFLINVPPFISAPEVNARPPLSHLGLKRLLSGALI